MKLSERKDKLRLWEVFGVCSFIAAIVTVTFVFIAPEFNKDLLGIEALLFCIILWAKDFEEI